jgi:hypothetical protein
LNSYNAGIFTTPAYINFALLAGVVKIYKASVVITAQKYRRIGFTMLDLAL